MGAAGVLRKRGNRGKCAMFGTFPEFKFAEQIID